MIRKMLVVAAAIAMPVSFIAVSGNVAGAATLTAAEAASIHCTTEAVTVNLDPAISNTGVTSGPVSRDTLTGGSITGCTITGLAADTGTWHGTISGTLTGKKPPSVKHPGSTCAGLDGTTKDTGTITVSWSGGSGPAIPPSSITLKDVLGGTTGSPIHGKFTIQGKPGKTSSFQGTDKGADDNLTSETDEAVGNATTPGTILYGCGQVGGVSSLGIEATSTGFTLK